MTGLERVRVVLCDADDCLFASETLAFEASTGITNRFLAEIGSDRRFAPADLRRWAVGRNFRATATDLAVEEGVALDPALLDRWVERERRAVVAHLRGTLVPDPEVRGPLEALAGRFDLAVVSSSALSRLDACFAATDLAGLLPPEVRFSAEDSLPVPTSKPDPAVYAHAGERLGVDGDEAVAVEDSVSGTRSARAAGFPVVGNVRFVPPEERDARVRALREAGAIAVVASWRELGALLPAGRSPARMAR